MITIKQTEYSVYFGETEIVKQVKSKQELVPNPLYFEILSQNKVLKSLADCLSWGEKHFLLIGNQGVGKNKLVDYFLHLTNMEREYIQLHRDSTIQSLTLSPTVVNGVVVYEDSPLLKAVQHGRVLVVDEADKAPLEVVAVLKALVDNGEVLLSDEDIE